MTKPLFGIMLILLTIAFLASVAVSIRQIVTTCRQWLALARRYPLGERPVPDRQTRAWRVYVGSFFRPFQHLRLAWDERSIFLIPLKPKDPACATLFISRRAWRKSGQPLPPSA